MSDEKVLHELFKTSDLPVVVEDSKGLKWEIGECSVDWSGFWAIGLSGQKMRILGYYSKGYKVLERKGSSK